MLATLIAAAVLLDFLKANNEGILIFLTMKMFYEAAILKQDKISRK
jgi:hypothetical protein